MNTHPIVSADACLQLAESAPPEQRRILLDLAGRWLASQAYPQTNTAKRLNEAPEPSLFFQNP
jgi:hypothetical protein